MTFECLGVTGYAGDRTPHAMAECHAFATSFSSFVGVDCTLVGEPQEARDLPWDRALSASKDTFDEASKNVNHILRSHRKPIIVTPRCATAMSTLPIIVYAFPDVIVLYFDAHGDLHTPQTSTSGYLGGMPLTAVMGDWESGYGKGLKPENLVHIGGRDIDHAEWDYIRRNKIKTFSKNKLESSFERLKSIILNKHVFIHLDCDAMDASEVTAEYAVANGLDRHHLANVVDMVVDHANLIGIQITELSPRTTYERDQSYTTLFESFAGLKALS